MRARTILPLSLMLSFLTIGCGDSGPPKASVTGKVTFEGKPVTKGTVTFLAIDPKGRNATGAIGPDGSYTLQTETAGDGALLGDYVVGISARDDEVLDYTPPKPIPPKYLVPAKYEDPKTSELKATVKSGSNSFPFDLK